MSDRKLPDELVERAAKAMHESVDREVRREWEDEPRWAWTDVPENIRATTREHARAALEAALSEGGTTQRFCLYHGATAVSDPEVTWCRIADRSNPKAADWCSVVEAVVIPLESKADADR